VKDGILDILDPGFVGGMRDESSRRALTFVEEQLLGIIIHHHHRQSELFFSPLSPSLTIKRSDYKGSTNNMGQFPQMSSLINLKWPIDAQKRYPLSRILGSSVKILHCILCSLSLLFFFQCTTTTKQPLELASS
jgi:hypothetical protein